MNTKTAYPAVEYSGGRAILDVMTPKRIARFLAKVDDSGGPFACWPHVGAPGPGSYRMVQGCDEYRGFSFLAHRVAWVLHHGREPREGFDVLHSCGNPPCCNWRHLREGTALDNARDMMERGRARFNLVGRPSAAVEVKEQALALMFGWSGLPPMLMGDVAEELEVHRTTLTRWLAELRPDLARHRRVVA